MRVGPYVHSLLLPLRSSRCLPSTLTSHIMSTLLRVTVQNISCGDRWLQFVLRTQFSR